jgi:hypothetical protein
MKFPVNILSTLNLASKKRSITLTPGTIYRGYAVSREPDDTDDLVLKRPLSAEIHVSGRTVNKPTLDAAIVVGGVEARKPHQDKVEILLVNEQYIDYCKRNNINSVGRGPGMKKNTGEVGLYNIDGKDKVVIKMFKAIPEYEPHEQYAPENVLKHEYFHARKIQEALDKDRLGEYKKNYKGWDAKEEREADEYAEFKPRRQR